MSFVIDSFATIVTNSDGARRRNRVNSAGLTRTECDVLLGLELAIARYRNPSLAEIASCSRDGIYPSGVHMYLRQLEAKGYVELPPRGQPRSIRLLKRSGNG